MLGAIGEEEQSLDVGNGRGGRVEEDLADPPAERCSSGLPGEERALTEAAREGLGLRALAARFDALERDEQSLIHFGFAPRYPRSLRLASSCANSDHRSFRPSRRAPVRS